MINFANGMLNPTKKTSATPGAQAITGNPLDDEEAKKRAAMLAAQQLGGGQRMATAQGAGASGGGAAQDPGNPSVPNAQNVPQQVPQKPGNDPQSLAPPITREQARQNARDAAIQKGKDQYAAKEGADSFFGRQAAQQGDPAPYNGHQNPPAPQAPAAPQTGFMDPAVAAALKQLMGQGGEDVAANMALAQQQSDRQLGQTLADNRAKSGFGGFGLSGAAQGMDQAARSQAAQQLTAAQLAAKQQGRDNQFRNLGLASDAFNSESQRQFGSSESTKQQGFQGGQNEKDREIESQKIAAITKYLDSLNPPPPDSQKPPDNSNPADHQNGETTTNPASPTDAKSGEPGFGAPPPDVVSGAREQEGDYGSMAPAYSDSTWDYYAYGSNPVKYVKKRRA